MINFLAILFVFLYFLVPYFMHPMIILYPASLLTDHFTNRSNRSIQQVVLVIYFFFIFFFSTKTTLRETNKSDRQIEDYPQEKTALSLTQTRKKKATVVNNTKNPTPTRPAKVENPRAKNAQIHK